MTETSQNVSEHAGRERACVLLGRSLLPTILTIIITGPLGG
ncbi:MAG TPA: hypothetical protein VFL79_14570 [Terriglobia bacterium]|nr:hypothetical protein [Terriglobia bacterium]